MKRLKTVRAWRLAGIEAMRRSRRHAWHHALLGSLLLPMCLGAAATAHAQSMSGFANKPDAPIEIESDRLEVADKKGTATFAGNVVVVQGDVRMKADKLTVYYASKQGSGGNRIEKIKATGSVHVSAPNEQSASGNWAEYQVATRRINMGDSVVLRQGKNVIRGNRLFVDLNSGESRVTGGKSSGGTEIGGNGRVKGLFQPPETDKKE
ncbi:lipopolysaccharide transport periplasmic protein LptA [Parvibaculum sp.]|uniref:lipopolysaccharide transport periplasmic protein LptA n=1 Tax=Parvibaculum sp. TaxID=2024848 RepID=UPI000C98307A|nr:lipopolysaccharide transport periplasmic protein LptA [Parvibaculum sp.]MAB12893.1 lipopolysaccharide transport periplasmic protein LptA [Parvibaculum sp.]